VPFPVAFEGSHKAPYPGANDDNIDARRRSTLHFVGGGGKRVLCSDAALKA